MLTFFSVPKPFTGNIAILQKNAIRSWKQVCPDCEILLFGDEPGIKEAAEEYGVRHIPEVKKNAYGTPTLDDIFNQARKLSENEIICYINCDIILTSDITKALNKIPFEKYLLVGQRTNLDIDTELEYNETWEHDLRQQTQTRGVREGNMGIDYFLYPKNSIANVLPFAVGRRGWDNWFIYNARKQGLPVIDCTPAVLVVHQNHGYGHIWQKTGTRWEGPESDINLNLIGNPVYLWDLDDADWILSEHGVARKPFSLLGVYRYFILHSPGFLLPVVSGIAEGIVKMKKKSGI